MKGKTHIIGGVHPVWRSLILHTPILFMPLAPALPGLYFRYLPRRPEDW